MKRLDLNYPRIQELKTVLNNNHVEYIYHRFFENKELTFDDWKPNSPPWQFPEDWLSRYHLYFDQYKHLLQNASILDIGANLNFYNTWAIENGAKSVDYIEPDEYKFKMGLEYLKLRNMEDVVNGEVIDIAGLMSKHYYGNHDVVFLLDVLYYTTNHIEIFNFIKNTIKPKFVFFECTVVDDTVDYPDGLVKLWKPRTNPAAFESYTSEQTPNYNPIGMVPSRKALFNMFQFVGFIVESMYDYKDYRGTGESPPRMSGDKVFMILR